MHRPDRLPLRTRLWRLLMTPVGKRVPVRKGRGAPHGIALFMVLIALALMSAIVTEFGYNELVRYKLAAHERDGLKAQALSEGGLAMSRLLLAVQAAIQPALAKVAEMGMPLPAYTVWQLVPLDSELMKGLTSGELQSAFGLNVQQALEEREEEHAKKMEEKRDDFDAEKEGAGNAPFEPPKGGFGAFDGNFVVEIEDEEQKTATLRGWSTSALTPAARYVYVQRLAALFAPERYDFLFEERDALGNRVDRAELIANLYDWADGNMEVTDPTADQTRWGGPGGGSEDGLYTGYRERNAMPKNAYFDSPGDLRRVHGWTDAHTRAFGKQISIYGENKINLMSASPQALESLVRICANDPTDLLLIDPTWMAETLAGWTECKMLGILGGCALSPEGFNTFLTSRGLVTNGDQCKNNISLESKSFTVRVTATVNDVSRTTTVVARVYGATEEFYYYSVR